MASGQLHHLVRQIRRAAEGPDGGTLTDGDLVKRFVTQRDDAAFAALVHRFGPLVLGACRRVLRHRQDAEDAFQATFLVLMHKAGSIARPELVGPWLYGVAALTARNARVSAARRRARERQVTEMAQDLPAAAEAELRELGPVLDEELGRLPEKYRVPVVLCDLQGKSRQEAARQLGCPEGTVSSRLARGRERLRERLCRRGLTLSAGALAVALSRDWALASVPAPLLSVTVQATLLAAPAGVVPAPVAALVEGVLKTMLLARLKSATLFLFALGALVGAGWLARQAVAQKPASPQEPPRVAAVKRDEGGETLTVSGQVLDPQGKPVAAARLFLPRPTAGRPEGKEEVEVVQRGVTAKDGQFELKLPRKDVPPGRAAVLLAAADGFGIDWTELPPGDPVGPLTLRLVRDVPIRGRVVSTEGKPLAGVTVRVQGVMVPTRLDGFFQDLERGWRAVETKLARQLALPLTPVLRVTPSDRDGRFEVAGAGAERLVGLQLQSAALARADLLVVTHEGFDARAVNQALAKGGRFPMALCGPTFDHVAEPNRRVEGVVREAGTGKPVAGARVQVTGNAGGSAVTDAEGRYRLPGLRRAPQYSLFVTPPESRALVGRRVSLPEAAGPLEPIRADVELPRGVFVTGRLSDRATGKGVEGQVSFQALPGNKFAGPATEGLTQYTSTDAGGKFRIVTLPGPGVLLATVNGLRPTVNGVRVYPYPVNVYKPAEFDAADRKRVQVTEEPGGGHSFATAGGGGLTLDFFNACKVVDVRDGDEAVSCDLAVDPGRALTVNVEDPEGKPLAGVIAAGVTAMPLGALSQKDASFPVYALDPGKPRQLALLHPERGLAARLTLRGDEKEPQTVRLGTTGVVTGRLVDREGQPVGGAEVGVLYAGAEGRDLAKELRRRGQAPRTDAQGRFRVEGIVPGMKFEVAFAKGRQELIPEARPKGKTVEAGKPLDLGDVRLKQE